MKDKYKSTDPITILIAEDDEEDRILTEEAIKESRLVNRVFFATDGEELMQYLLGKDPFANRLEYPLPGIILLDLNMPKKGGLECLTEIKANNILKRIPVVVLSTSKAEEDIVRSYDLGVSSFISKPVTFNSLVDIMYTLKKYWLEIVELPNV